MIGIVTSNDGDSFPSEAGFTLIELLVVIAVTGILSVVLLQVIQQTTEAVSLNQARTKLLSELTFAAQQMADQIRGEFSQGEMRQRKYRLIGVDGDEGKFEMDLMTHGRPLSDGSEADHFHMHATRTEYAFGSDRHRYGFFLNGGSHPELRDVNNDGQAQWGLFLRDENLPWGPEEIRLNHYDDLEAPLAFNVDYLSFRYLDEDSSDDNCTDKTDGKPENNGWYNSWDSHDDSLDYISFDGGNCYADYPEAVEYALRGYHPSGLVEPRWYVSTVKFGYDDDL